MERLFIFKQINENHLVYFSFMLHILSFFISLIFLPFPYLKLTRRQWKYQIIVNIVKFERKLLSFHISLLIDTREICGRFMRKFFAKHCTPWGVRKSCTSILRTICIIFMYNFILRIYSRLNYVLKVILSK